MRYPLLAGPIVLILGLTTCRSGGEKRAPTIGEAYAGPAALALRKDIPPQSPVAVTVPHGERLEILQHRRRFLKVRTVGGKEGWIEDHLLLSSDEIASLKEVERRARTLPTQGLASTYELLNVHTEPNRLSPSFLQIAAGEKVDVVAHVASPRTPPPRKPLLPPKPKQPKVAHKSPDTKYPPPPPPPAPPAPANWLELSKTPPEVAQSIAAAKAESAAPTDDWSLVRNAKGESGWVLTRRLYMAIPDDVAQYAEGHRITSYFPLGDVRDGDQVKHVWLWTTIAGGDHSYDFDSYRVFTWSLRRHRYETAFIQRNVEGYFPVLLRPVEWSAGSKARIPPDTATYPGFSVCVEDAHGARIRRSYAFIVTVVRSAGQQPCEAPASILQTDGAKAPSPQSPTPAAGSRSLFARLKALAKKWFNR
ncbi:MAG: SH3 domain-containing protein [Bryobacteraceae bacterium]|jgi:hypothetical protein